MSSFLQQGEPLGISRGSVRALLALLITGGFLAACFLSSVSPDARTALAGLAGAINTYYFQSRSKETEV